MLVVKAHAAEGYELSRFADLADAHRAARMAFQRQQALFSPAITLVYAATVRVAFFPLYSFRQAFDHLVLTWLG